MIKTVLNEPNQLATFYESVAGEGNSDYRILGKLKSPFFDLNKPTRNGRDYSEAAEDALAESDFQERFQTRTVFGRLGHPCTEEESAEDPAVRACVILSEYHKNPETNMYEGTFDILDNQYGRQLKSLVDAGCRMGVSTRGSGDSYESSNGEVIRRGSFDFEGVDIVTLPAVKEARCTVLEAFDKSKKKKLEAVISEATDKYVLESLKVTVEASGLPNKKELIESIDKKLNKELGKSEDGTTESLANDIVELSKKLTETENKLKEAEQKLNNESKSSSGTTESDKKSVNESTEVKNLIQLLQSSTKVIESMKKTVNDNVIKNKNLSESVKTLTEEREKLIKENEFITKTNKTLLNENASLKKDNKKLSESYKGLLSKSVLLENKNSENSKLVESIKDSKKLIESLKKSESDYKAKCESLNKDNQVLVNNYNSLKNKYSEIIAEAYGISKETLKLKLTPKSTVEMIESAAKSIRDAEDARKMALPNLMDLGKKVEAKQVSFEDPELGRAGRIASLTKSS